MANTHPLVLHIPEELAEEIIEDLAGVFSSGLVRAPGPQRLYVVMQLRSWYEDQRAKEPF